MSELIVHLTDDTFETDVVKSPVPVLVDFWADWCGPCKMIAALLDEIAAEYRGRLKVAKLNIDQNSRTPPTFGIRGIPTLLLSRTARSRRQRSAPSRNRNWWPSSTATSDIRPR